MPLRAGIRICGAPTRFLRTSQEQMRTLLRMLSKAKKTSSPWQQHVYYGSYRLEESWHSEKRSNRKRSYFRCWNRERAKHGCPSGPRGYVKAVMCSHSRVRVPLRAFFFPSRTITDKLQQTDDKGKGKASALQVADEEDVMRHHTRLLGAPLHVRCVKRLEARTSVAFYTSRE